HNCVCEDTGNKDGSGAGSRQAQRQAAPQRIAMIGIGTTHPQLVAASCTQTSTIYATSHGWNDCDVGKLGAHAQLDEGGQLECDLEIDSFELAHQTGLAAPRHDVASRSRTPHALRHARYGGHHEPYGDAGLSINTKV
ncbi:hypothetical protein HK105_203617, partial [Polyrhizophydium stewartii]